YAAIAKQRRRAARELERCPGVRGEIGRGLIATPVQDAEASLRINEAPHRLVESRTGNRSRAHGVGDQAVSLELSALVEPEQKIVRACLDRAEPGRRLANALERTHLEVVGHNKSLKTERVAYEIGHHGLRERHWELGGGIEGRNDDVRAHDRGDAGRDRSAERRKLDAVERRPIRLDLGQAGVRVRRRRAMPWEMLRA